jgi:hypothetical protein
MANQFVSLPTPAANGSGAAVDVSTFGGVKTVASSGNGFTFEPTVTIEFSNELVPTRFAPLWTFGKPGEKTILVAARWMRATVSNYRGGGSPVVDVGGNDAGALFATLVAPAGNGAGAGVDVTALPGFRTIHVAGPFRGALNIEISEDAGATWSQIATLMAPGYRSLEFVSEFMRVTRVGVPQNSPGLPVINVGAVQGGGGQGGVVVEDEGVPIGVGTFDTLNFLGGGVVASDAGGGDADIIIPGITFEDEGVPLAGAPHDTVDFVGDITAVDGGGGRVTVTVTSPGGSILFFGTDNVGAAADTRFIPPGHDSGLAVTSDRFQLPAPRAGTLRNLFVRHNSAGGNGNSVTYTVLVNGVAVAITVALATGAIGQASDLVNSVAVAQGDQISLRAVKDLGIGGGNIDLEASLEVT